MSYFAPYIDGTGIHLPTYEDRMEDLVSAYRSVFGQEAAMDASVPDYQLLSVFAKALDDVSALVLQAYNSRNPMYASGNALDLLLPQYGLSRISGETDAEARARISASLAGRGTSTHDALLAAVRSAKSVKSAKVYVNDGDATDSNGIPAHSIAVVTRSGNAAAIAQAIYDRKAPGIGTYGSTTQNVTDSWGNTIPIRFSRVTEKTCMSYIWITKLEGCDEAAVEAAVSAAVRNFIADHEIAEPLIVPQLYAVCYAADPALSGTFVVSDIQIGVPGAAATERDLVECAWNEKVAAPVNSVSITFRTR